MTWVLVAVAGGLGAWCRFRLDTLIGRRWPGSVPVGTLAINLLGSLALGLLTGHALTHGGEAAVLFVVGTGLLGGFTTFSTATVEVVRLAMSRRRIAAVVLYVGMMVLCVAAAMLGWAAGAATG